MGGLGENERGGANVIIFQFKKLKSKKISYLTGVKHVFGVPPLF